jgi:hypothetical protein
MRTPADALKVQCVCGLEYLHHSPENRKRPQKVDPVANESRVSSQVLWDLDPRVTALAGPSSTCTSKLQTRPLVRNATLIEKTANV